MPIPPEMNDEQVKAIQKAQQPIEEHQVIPDRRFASFMSIEDFERKWNLNQPSK